MKFRNAKETDVKRMMEMVNQAKASMKAMGIDQWQRGYPDEAAIREDLENQVNYVLEEDGSVVGMITIVFGEEEAYKQIDGAWLNDEPYASFHRVCVDGNRKGRGLAGILFREGEAFCKSHSIRNLRNDTHPDNLPMQHAVEKFGFVRCGMIKIVGTPEDGSPRAAYQKIME